MEVIVCVTVNYPQLNPAETDQTDTQYDPVCIKDADLQSRRTHMVPLHL